MTGDNSLNLDLSATRLRRPMEVPDNDLHGSLPLLNVESPRSKHDPGGCLVTKPRPPYVRSLIIVWNPKCSLSRRPLLVEVWRISLSIWDGIQNLTLDHDLGSVLAFIVELHVICNSARLSRSRVCSARAVVDDGTFEIARGDDHRPDATIETNPTTLAALVYDGLGIEEALSSGDLKIEGSKQAVERFLGLFSLPEPAAPAAGT